MKKSLILFVFLTSFQAAFCLDRQANADYHARREALAKKTDGAVVVLFAPMEAAGPNAVYGFRQDDNFFYLSGWAEPGAALVIAPAAPGSAGKPARPYTEILFLAANNSVQEKWTGPKLGPQNPDAPKITGFDKVEVLDKLRDELAELVPPGRSKVFTDVSNGQESPSTNGLNWLTRQRLCWLCDIPGREAADRFPANGQRQRRG